MDEELLKVESFKTELKQFTVGTYFINLPKEVVDGLHLEKFDKINVSISRASQIFETYQCSVCKYVFDTNNLEPYCPACNSTALTVFSEGDVMETTAEELTDEKLDKLIATHDEILNDEQEEENNNGN